MKKKCIWTDTNPAANCGNKPGGEESGCGVTEFLCSLAASTPSLPLMTNQKNCFSMCQNPGMKSTDYPSAGLCTRLAALLSVCHAAVGVNGTYGLPPQLP